MGILQRMEWGNWRSFTREIAIVVIGVLVALGADDVADDWNWQRKLVVGESALRREAADNFFYAAEQAAVAPCIEAQLVAARRRVLASKAILDPAPLYPEAKQQPYVYRTPSRPYVSSAWQALLNEGTTSRMSVPRRTAYAVVYQQLSDLAIRRNQLEALSARSRLLAEPLPLDPDTRALLVGDLMETAGQMDTQARVAAQVMASLRDLGQAPPGKQVDTFIFDSSGTFRFCKARGLPLADWRTVLAGEEVEAVE